jgi:ATP-dependent helicase YprA (DUF1998 family)
MVFIRLRRKNKKTLRTISLAEPAEIAEKDNGLYSASPEKQKNIKDYISRRARRVHRERQKTMVFFRQSRNRKKPLRSLRAQANEMSGREIKKLKNGQRQTAYNRG